MLKTKIEWTEFSSNPIRVERLDNGKRGWACTKPSTGCKNCYAETINKVYGTGLPYHQDSLDKIRFFVDMNELQRILKRKKPAKIFIGDMLDIFHEAIGFNELYKLFEYMHLAKQHTFQVLSKRAKRMSEIMRKIHFHLKRNYPDIQTPLPNVQLGISAENQKALNERYPWLAATPASVRFLSIEPLLDWINISHQELANLQFVINWIIVGCESGRSPRPMELAWVKDIKDFCVATKIPFFFKQAMDENKKKISLPVLDGQQWTQSPRMEAAR